MTGNYQTIIPKNLTLWLENRKLKFKAETGEIKKEFLDILKSNKEYLIGVLESKPDNFIKIYPVAYNQKALWFINQMNPEVPAYNVGIACKVIGKPDIVALDATLKILIEKFWPLRSKFKELFGEEGSCLCQLVENNYSPVISVHEIQSQDENMISAAIRDDNNKPYNLEGGLLFRTNIYSLPSHYYLSFSFHHIICDALSIQHFLKSFIKVYSSLLAKTEIGNNAPSSNYDTFIYDQNNFLNSSAGKEQIRYWKESLKNVSQHLNLPYDMPKPQVHKFSGDTIYFNIGDKDYTDIHKFCNENKITPNVFLFTAFELLLTEIAGETNFCIGVPASSRTKPEYNETFGYLITILPIVCNSKQEFNIIDHLKTNAEKIYKALENQDIPFPVIVDEIAAKRNPAETPIFQTLYNFLNLKLLKELNHFIGSHTDPVSWEQLMTAPLKIKDQEGQFDLTLEILDNNKELFGCLKYNNSIFKETSIQLYIKRFREILDYTIKNTTYRIAPEKSKTRLNINITGTFTVEPVKKALEFWLDKLNIRANLNFVGYNQVLQQLFNPNSDFNISNNQTNIIFVRLYDFFKSLKSKQEIDKIFEELKNGIISNIKAKPTNKLLVVFCPFPKELVITDDFNSKASAFEDLIEDLGSIFNNLVVIKSSDFETSYGLSDYYESLGEEVGNIPYKDNFFAVASTFLARKLFSSLRPPFKVVVVDCDNTLWKGIVGEDGPLGIQIDKSHTEFQNFLVSLAKSGLLICLCSKNNEKDVWEVFEKNKNMVLTKDLIINYKLNWNPKSQNLIELAKELNLGLDSFIFIDDNPLECEEVKAKVPVVLTIRKKTDEENLDYLYNSWAFDLPNYLTAEDKQRALMYKNEVERDLLKSNAKTFKDFINELDIKLQIKEVTHQEISRISQLTYRTNQFNFTTLRRSESDLVEMMSKSGNRLFYAHLSDKFGDYGIIGAIFTNEQENVLYVDTFLLSCRALGKGVEHKLIAYLAEYASGKNCNTLAIQLNRTEKNKVAELFLNTHFKNYQISDSDGTLLLNIPVEVARSFEFDPEKNLVEENEQKQQPVLLKEDIALRNSIYQDILENFIDAKSITNHIFKPSSSANGNKTTGVKETMFTEETILNIWKEVLDNDQITTQDNFFDVGGQSILIPKIVIYIKTRLNIKINIVDVFKYPTVKALTIHISDLAEPEDIVKPKDSIVSESQLNNMRRQRERFKNIRVQ